MHVSLYITFKEPHTNLFGVEDAVAENVVTVSLWDIGMRSVECPSCGLDGTHMNSCGGPGRENTTSLKNLMLQMYITGKREREKYGKRERLR